MAGKRSLACSVSTEVFLLPNRQGQQRYFSILLLLLIQWIICFLLDSLYDLSPCDPIFRQVGSTLFDDTLDPQIEALPPLSVGVFQ